MYKVWFDQLLVTGQVSHYTGNDGVSVYGISIFLVIDLPVDLPIEICIFSIYGTIPGGSTREQIIYTQC